MKRQSRRGLWGGATILVATVVALAAALGVPAPALADTPVDKPNAYGTDYFDEEYSAGYLHLKDGVATGSDWTTETRDYHLDYYGGATGTVYRASNGQRDAGSYIDYTNGASIGGVDYDVREYDWMPASSNPSGASYWIAKSNGSIHTWNHASEICREFHFYPSGTLAKENHAGTIATSEVAFKGILRFGDCDTTEGYAVNKGLHGVWIDPKYRSTMRYNPSNNAWVGTVNHDNEYDTSNTNTVWFEVSSDAQNPLTISYVCAGYQAQWYWSTINYQGNTMKYQLVGEGAEGLSVSDLDTGCATYSNYTPVDPSTILTKVGLTPSHYEFDGWYTGYDQATGELSGRVSGVQRISKDTTYYGSIRKVAGAITTEVKNGTITPSIDPASYGRDHTVSYKPNDGFLLDTVTVDGKAVDPAADPDGYSFANLQPSDDGLGDGADHHVAVAYAAPSIAKSVADASGADAGAATGRVLEDGTALTYTIAVDNPTGVGRDVTVEDALPEGLEYDSCSDGGSYDKKAREVSWELSLEPGATKTLALAVRTVGGKDARTVTNAATATWAHLAGSASESDVAKSASVDVAVAARPVPATPETPSGHPDGKTAATAADRAKPASPAARRGALPQTGDAYPAGVVALAAAAGAACAVGALLALVRRRGGDDA